METATVDIRRLQALSDCINRTIDALNQVRLSVHGVGSPNGLGGVPGIGGLGHAAGQNPWVTSPLAASWGNQSWGNPSWGNPLVNPYAAVGANPLVNPYNPLVGAGLGHTPLGSTYADPYATARIAQTFPFLHWGYSPFGWSTV